MLADSNIINFPKSIGLLRMDYISEQLCLFLLILKENRCRNHWHHLALNFTLYCILNRCWRHNVEIKTIIIRSSTIYFYIAIFIYYSIIKPISFGSIILNKSFLILIRIICCSLVLVHLIIIIWCSKVLMRVIKIIWSSLI